MWLNMKYLVHSKSTSNKLSIYKCVAYVDSTLCEYSTNLVLPVMRCC